jgi:HEPN domain-containing protein
MNAAADAARWLVASKDDLDFARLAAANGFHAQACFHAQQAAEKAIKALHFAHGARSVIGHSIRKLIESLEPRIAALDRCLDGARELDLFYIPARYPNGLDSGTPKEAFGASQSSRALAHATSIITSVDAELSKSR